MASRKIEDLDPRVQEKAHEIVREWENKNLNVLITATFRSNEEQARLYAQGRTAPGAIVTHAQAGESYHNTGLALDYVPLVHGKVVWDADSKLWQIIALVAIEVDPRVQWGGAWSGRKKDLPHIEWHLPPEAA